MICPRCKVEMDIGMAIPSDNPYERSIAFYQTVWNSDTLKLIDCWKCPKCGYSDDGKR